VVTVGGAVCGVPLEVKELPPSPHPHIKRPDIRNIGNIAPPVLTWILHEASEFVIAPRRSSSKQRDLCHVKDRRYTVV
jgi:hypothetical protein